MALGTAYSKRKMFTVNIAVIHKKITEINATQAVLKDVLLVDLCVSHIIV